MNKQKFWKMEGVCLSDIGKIWDVLAPMRYQDIVSGKDRSYTEVLLPLMEEYIEKYRSEKLLDAGCGVGFISELASKYFDVVDAVDISPMSIKMANMQENTRNISFINSSVEDFSVSIKEKYDIVISSMVLMDCPNQENFLSSCYKLTKRGGKIVMTLCHPFFWPRYWGFERRSWFNYGSEVAIGSYFRTSSTGISSIPTVYFHRPLTNYLSTLAKLGVRDIRIREISGIAVGSKILNRYPRYLLIEITK